MIDDISIAFRIVAKLAAIFFIFLASQQNKDNWRLEFRLLLLAIILLIIATQ